jgi:hypothetical protein
MKKLLIFLFLFLLIPAVCFANDIYVRADGTAASEGAAVGPCATQANTATLANANSWADTGDTVILCDDGGNYSTGINPTASPTQESERIIYEKASGDTPNLNAVGTCISLINKSYITVDGITCTSPTVVWINMIQSDGDAGSNTSDYNIIKNSTFTTPQDVDIGWGGVYIKFRANYNQFLDNSFTVSGNGIGGFDDLIYFRGSDTAGTMNYNVFVGNTVFGGHHAALEAQKRGTELKYNVFKDNTLSSPIHTSMNLTGDYNLVDGNTIHDTAAECVADQTSCNENTWGSAGDKATDRDNHPDIQFSTNDYTIFRRNKIYNGSQGFTHTCNASDTDSLYTRIYHNTIYNNWWGIFSNTAGDISYAKYVNNIFLDNYNANEPGGDDQPYDGTHSVRWSSTPGTANSVKFYNNIIHSDDTTDVLFVWAGGGWHDIDWYDTNHATNFSGNDASDPLLVDPANQDFTPDTGSPAINAGTSLTLTNGTGSSSTALIVDDSIFFYTTGSPWNTPGTRMVDDTIYVAAATPFTTTITAINYGTHTLTLASAQTWEDGVAVYHCPDAVCFSGSAPEIGADEYTVAAGGGSGTVTGGGSGTITGGGSGTITGE